MRLNHLFNSAKQFLGSCSDQLKAHISLKDKSCFMLSEHGRLAYHQFLLTSEYTDCAALKKHLFSPEFQKLSRKSKQNLTNQVLINACLANQLETVQFILHSNELATHGVPQAQLAVIGVNVLQTMEEKGHCQMLKSLIIDENLSRSFNVQEHRGKMPKTCALFEMKELKAGLDKDLPVNPPNKASQQRRKI